MSWLDPLSSSTAEITNSSISRAWGHNVNEQRELGLRNILRGEELWKTCEHMLYVKGQ